MARYRYRLMKVDMDAPALTETEKLNPEVCLLSSVVASDQYEWFLKIVWGMFQTFVGKNTDYAGGKSNDWLCNFRGGGLRGIYNRMDDKFMRLRTFLRTGKLKNESFDDSCLDLAVYCLILKQSQTEKLSVEGEYWDEGK